MLRLRLVIEDDDGKTTVVPLIRDEITIGRMEGNTIRLTERNVSRRHARLLRAGDNGSPAVLVEDLDSYNGVRLNGDRIAHQCTIRPGDLIQIGDYALALRAEEPAGTEVAEAATAVQPMPRATVDEVATVVHQVDAALPEERRGKLVVVSSNLQGDVFNLAQREVIIGRTDENDVVINHRSISRNHAKIIFRDDKFTIIDLASSNGVKVNGEPFGTASLVNGDIVELGHVKMRYVAPGDDYVFSPADIDDVEVDGGVGGGRLTLILAVLVLVALATFFIVRRDDAPKAPDPKPGASVTPPPIPEPPPAAPEVDVAALMSEGKSFLEGEKWSEAANIFGRVLQAQPEHAEAQALKKKASSEAENQRKYEQLLEDMNEGQWTDAFFALEDFPKDSVFAPRLDEKRDRIQRGFAEGETERAMALVESKNFDGARKVQAALALKPFAAKSAADLLREIDAAERALREAAAAPPEREPEERRPEAARPRPPKPRPEARDKPTPPAAAPQPPPEPRDDGYEDAMAQALTLIAHGQRAEAITLLETANRLRPGSKFPHQRLCAIYPNTGQLQKALRHCKLWLAKESNEGYKPAIKKKIQLLEDELNR